MFLAWVGTFLLVFFTVLAVVGLIAKIYGLKASLDKYMRRAVERAGTLLLTMGLFGLLLYFFVYESVPILSMRFWLMFWLILTAIWVWRIVHYVRVEVPKIHQLKAEREHLNKWLPKAKR